MERSERPAIAPADFVGRRGPCPLRGWRWLSQQPSWSGLSGSTATTVAGLSGISATAYPVAAGEDAARASVSRARAFAVGGPASSRASGPGPLRRRGLLRLLPAGSRFADSDRDQGLGVPGRPRGAPESNSRADYSTFEIAAGARIHAGRSHARCDGDSRPVAAGRLSLAGGAGRTTMALLGGCCGPRGNRGQGAFPAALWAASRTLRRGVPPESLLGRHGARRVRLMEGRNLP